MCENAHIHNYIADLFVWQAVRDDYVRSEAFHGYVAFRVSVEELQGCL